MKPVNYILTTGATNLPLVLDDVKDWLKIPSTMTVDDSLITALIKASAGYFEKITGRDLINKTYKTYLDRFPCVDDIGYYSGVSPIMAQYQDNGIVIQKSKLQSITSIQYYIDGVLTVWDSSNYYFTDEADYSGIYLVDNKTFPSIDTRKQAITITFVAGYGVDESDIPEDVKQALMQFISYLYENRGDCASSKDMDAAMQLFGQFRIINL